MNCKYCDGEINVVKTNNGVDGPGFQEWVESVHCTNCGLLYHPSIIDFHTECSHDETLCENIDNEVLTAYENPTKSKEIG